MNDELKFTILMAAIVFAFLLAGLKRVGIKTRNALIISLIVSVFFGLAIYFAE